MGVTLIRADTLLDGTGGPAIRGGAAVLIDGDTIQADGPRDAVAAPSEAEIVVLDDATILPGIVDGHVHLMLGVPDDPFHLLAQRDQRRMFAWGAANAQACLANGLWQLATFLDISPAPLTLSSRWSHRTTDTPR